MRHLKFGNLNIVYTEKIDGNQKNPKNRLEVLKRFNFHHVYIPDQKHTSKVVDIKGIKEEADGIFTDKKRVPVGVITADCIPVVLFDGRNISVLHAGWRGLFAGIIQNGLKNHDLKNTTAYIMPSIRQCCYEVSREFIKNYNIGDKFFTLKNGKPYLSLQNLAKQILIQNKIDKIYEVPLCTACCDKLYSYRKGDFEERILTFAWYE